MIAAAMDRPAPATNQLRKVACSHCGGFLCDIGVNGDLVPGLAWTRLRCPNRRCASWTVLDVATGQPLAGLDRLRGGSGGVVH